MNRVSRRANAILLLVILLSGGLAFFLYEYTVYAEKWILSPGSPHVFNSANIGTGQIVDRGGTLLLDLTSGRTYAESARLRKSTVHWLGDRNGSISAPAIAHYGKEMTGYDLINGLYNYSGQTGVCSLTLSAPVQKAALTAMGDHKGTIAVYNYKTGEILCAVTTPTYDPDDVPDVEGDESGKYEGLFLNRFTQSVYIPGSIFKVVTTAAALACVDGIEEMEFTCKGEYQYGIDKVSCEKKHGTKKLADALTSSCNCIFAQVANLVGAENLQKYADQFAITEPVRFDGITTARGHFDVSDAAEVELAWGGIGQYTDQINPCRYMTFMGAIAGGGEAAEPHLVDKIKLGTEVTYRAEAVSTGRIMDAEIAETLQTYMRNNVVNNYGAKNFPGLTVCAKSGTSQLGGGQKSNAMFAGFVTDAEYPLAFIVVVENGGYGASTCVPILSKVLAACKEVLDGE